jgi:hypothetical protein
MSMKSEKYTSKKAMMKHEKKEGPSARKMEYGSATGGMFGTKKKAVAKKTAMKKMGKKK